MPRILLTAPSNAAVDEIVRKLLDCRQKLKPEHRFNMMRIGKPHVVHPEVRPICLEILKENQVSRSKNKDQNGDSLRLQIEEYKRRIQFMSDKLANKSTPNDEVLLITRKISDEIKGKKIAEEELKRMQFCKPNYKEKAQAVEELLAGADIVAATLNSTLNGQMNSFFIQRHQK